MRDIYFNNKLEDKIKEIISNLCCNSSFIYALIVVTFILMCFFLRINSTQYPIIAIFIILGLLTYLYIIKFQHEEIIQYNWKPKWIKTLLFIYCICFISSLIHIKFLETYYHKSLIYYIFISICITSLFLISAVTNGKHRSLIIFLLTILALNIFFSNSIVFPFGVYTSQDTHFQIYKILVPILEDGKVPSGFTYSFFPLHHIYVSITSLIININPVILYLYLVAPLYLTILLFIYMICKRTIGLIFAEFSIILYLISPEIIYSATHAYQYSYALPIGVLLLFITVFSFKHKSNNVPNVIYSSSSQSWSILNLILLIAVVWTHHFTSMLIFSLVLIIILASLILNHQNISFLWNLIILFIVVIFGHWTYVSSILNNLVLVVDIYSSSLFGLENYQYAATTIYSAYQAPFLFIFMDSLVKSTIISLAAIGTLYGFVEKNEYVYIIASWGLFIFILISIGAFIKMPLLMSGRLFSLFFMVFAIYLAAKGIIILNKRLGKKGIIILSIILFFASISGLGNTSSGSETSLFLGDELSYKFYDTTQDVKLKEWIIREIPLDSSIRINGYWKLSYDDVFRNYGDIPVNDLDQIESSSINSGEYFVLTRDYLSGFRVHKISEVESFKLIKNTQINPAEAEKLFLRLTKINPGELERARSDANCIYSTSAINVCLN